MVGEKRRESVMGGVGLGDDEQAGRVLVDAVHNAGLLHPADARQALAAMGDQRIDQRAVSCPLAGLHDEARRLVDDDEMVTSSKTTSSAMSSACGSRVRAAARRA